MSTYRVTGRHFYRDHAPGDTFDAELDLVAQQRAIARGDIELLNPAPTTLQPDTWRMPRGWPPPTTQEV